jgi:hypothetical protein
LLFEGSWRGSTAGGVFSAADMSALISLIPTYQNSSAPAAVANIVNPNTIIFIFMVTS